MQKAYSEQAMLLATQLRLLILDESIQWIIVMLLYMQFLFLTIVKIRLHQISYKQGYGFSRAELPVLIFASISIVRYIFSYNIASQSFIVPIFFFGLCVYAATSLLYFHGSRHTASIALILMTGTLLTREYFLPFKQSLYSFGNVARFSGSYENPNLFGITMAAISVAGTIGFSRICSCIYLHARSTQLEACLRANYFKMGCALIVVAAVTCVSLDYTFRSYSRAAWLAATITLLTAAIRSVCHSSRPFMNRILAITTGAMLLTCALVYCSITTPLAKQMTHRIESIADMSDRSVSNRLAAWSGAGDMIKAKPIFGWGWNNVKTVYENAYKPVSIRDGSAVLLNDYLTIAASVGIPCVLCFFMFSFNTLRFVNNSLNGTAYDDVLKCVIMTMMVGFAFNGGLFKFSTSIPFWLISGLLNVHYEHPSQHRNNVTMH